MCRYDELFPIALKTLQRRIQVEFGREMTLKTKVEGILSWILLRLIKNKKYISPPSIYDKITKRLFSSHKVINNICEGAYHQGIIKK